MTGEEEDFAGVGAVLWYEQFSFIYVVQDGQRWEHLPGVYSKRKYFYAIDAIKFFESDDLEKVERVMFKDFLKNQW